MPSLLQTGMDLIFLGTSSARATMKRNTSCLALHYDQGIFLFDCGEGTSRQLLQSSLNKGKINKVFLTHLHGDHIYGLPGLIMQTLENKQQLEIYAPAGIKELMGRRTFENRGVKLVQIHKRNSPFPIEKDDIPYDEGNYETVGIYSVYEDENIKVRAGHIVHTVFCLGYVVEEKKRLK
jgi:ribonuclease Z